ncbi:MAG: hypothetical protein JW787_00915 [Sedimentisphaerales bacterium]|nr:hypothetical protein [Sedimentisphaerales bacterium]
MYKEENLTPAERALESALGQLKPVANALNRDEFMFNAGRASVGRKLPWQMFSVALTVLLLCSFLFRPGMNETYNLPPGSKQNQFQIVQTQYQPAEAGYPDSMSYPILRENVIKYGLDALQFQENAGNQKPLINQKELLDSILS